MFTITHTEYNDFIKYYFWEHLRKPHLRVGQAFLQYFPEYNDYLLGHGFYGHSLSRDLLRSNNAQWCWATIQQLVLEKPINPIEKIN